jgi:hypothetical protein
LPRGSSLIIASQPPATSLSLFAALAEGSEDDDDFEVERAPSESAKLPKDQDELN